MLILRLFLVMFFVPATTTHAEVCDICGRIGYPLNPNVEFTDKTGTTKTCKEIDEDLKQYHKDSTECTLGVTLAGMVCCDVPCVAETLAAMPCMESKCPDCIEEEEEGDNHILHILSDSTNGNTPNICKEYNSLDVPKVKNCCPDCADQIGAAIKCVDENCVDDSTPTLSLYTPAKCDVCGMIGYPLKPDFEFIDENGITKTCREIDYQLQQYGKNSAECALGTLAGMFCCDVPCVEEMMMITIPCVEARCPHCMVDDRNYKRRLTNFSPNNVDDICLSYEYEDAKQAKRCCPVCAAEIEVTEICLNNICEYETITTTRDNQSFVMSTIQSLVWLSGISLLHSIFY